MERKWINSSVYPNILQGYAENEKEYKQLVARLVLKHSVYNRFIADEWMSEEEPIDDWEFWHELFRSDEHKNFDIEEFTNPIEYSGEIELKPNEEEYPVVVSFINGDEYEDKKVYWICLNSLKGIK